LETKFFQNYQISLTLSHLICILVVYMLITGFSPHLYAQSQAKQEPKRLRILFDDYYQHERPNDLFGQGVARGGKELRDLTNPYSPDATAIPNGTFAFTQLLSDKFTVEISRKPLTAELLKNVSVYMMMCPVKVELGGRADLGEHEAEILKEFVAKGGNLVLVANSAKDLTQIGWNRTGLNIIARQFGLQFEATQTETMSIPISNTHSFFDGVSSIIYGNGTTIEVLPSGDPATQVLFESHNPSVPGPVAVIAPYKRGKVLLFGDAGSFGNAHVSRSDVPQGKALKQLIYGLLPDGPVAQYGWKEGIQLKANVKQEQVITGYPATLRVFSLPRSKDSQLFTSGMRQIDLNSADGKKQLLESPIFASAVSTTQAEFTLDIGAIGGGNFQTVWRHEEDSLDAILLANGRFRNPGLPTGGNLIEWQKILLNDLLCAPLKAYANPGDEWNADGVESLPNLQLSMTPKVVTSPMNISFIGESTYKGQSCYLFQRIINLDGENWSPSDIVEVEYGHQFNEREIDIFSGRQYSVAKYWVKKDSLLPLYTEINLSASLWWRDSKYPSKYIGSHDTKTYENWKTTVLTVSYGMKLTAEFSENSSELEHP